MRLVVVVVVVVVSAVASVRGQDLAVPTGAATAAVTRESMPQHLTPVFVQPTNGRAELSGHLLNLGPDTLTLLVDGQRVELPLERVLRIQTPDHSVKNGGWIGGLIAGAWCAFVCGQGLDRAGQWPATVAVAAAFGAVIGAGIDAAIPGRTTIYQKSTPPSIVARAPRAAVVLNVRF